MQQTISCDTLGGLSDGQARAIIDAAIGTVVADIDARGDDEKPRQVVITLTLSRRDNGQVAADVQADARMPKRRTTVTVAAIRRQAGRAGLIYQDMATDNPNQTTIDSLEG